MKLFRIWRSALLVLCCVGVGAVLAAYLGKSTEASAAPQDVISLDRRISMLEQRIVSIDSTLRSLEQQSMMAQRSSSTSVGRDSTLALLRDELLLLQRRQAELDCAIAKLDERTLSSAVRQTLRQNGATPGDPCRLHPEAPIRLSGQP
jgi:predicted  nucleic acid-binding Zn-ribbon protein